MALFDNVEFRSFDYDGFRQSLFQLAKQQFPDWSDTLESNQGVMFIEWLAFMAANFTFQQNFLARQGFVPTVTEPKNLAKLAKQYDYHIPNNTSATVDVTIAKSDATAFQFDFILPLNPPTVFKTSGTEQLIFESIATLTIPSGSFSGIVAAQHKETKTKTDFADGKPDFKSTLDYGPYIEGSISLTVDGVTWTPVNNFLDSGATSEHYRVEVNSESVVTVIFGDGVNGKIPILNSLIFITYAVGGGAIGNIAPSAISEIEGTFTDVNGNILDLVVTNANPGQGGADRESVPVTKLRLPASLASKEITIDYEDFETNITNVPGVARVSVKTVNDNPNIPENLVMCFILPTASDVLDQALEQQIQDAMVTNPRPLTQSMYLVGPQFVTIDMDVRDLLVDPEFDDGSGTKANASITVINNTFNAGDAVIVNGVQFTRNVEWVAGINVNDTAVNIKTAIEASNDPLLQDIEATVLNNVVTLTARTTGIHGNAYTLSEIDGATDNFTLSNPTFEQGTDSTVQAAIRAAVEAFFGRSNIDENGRYTVEFGGTVYRNRLICVVQDVFGVKAFDLLTPADDTVLDVGEFPKYTLKFTTS